MTHAGQSASERLAAERRELLHRIETSLEAPMVALAFIWLLLLGVELLSPAAWARYPVLDQISLLIWAVFVLDFGVEWLLAPDRRQYLARNWLTAVSLLVPALRLLRIARVIKVMRVARAARGARLVRVIGSLNRGMRTLGASMRRRGFGYVATLTVFVTLGGAAGMFTFERDVPAGLTTYGESLWWTAMLMTTMGSAYWPVTAEGRILCVVLALYAFAVFGYVTAALATHFIGRDADAEDGEIPSAAAIAAVHQEIAALRREVQARGAQPERHADAGWNAASRSTPDPPR